MYIQYLHKSLQIRIALPLPKAEQMNFTTIDKIRARLINIMDSVLSSCEGGSGLVFGLDEAKLEEWCCLLREIVLDKQKVVEPIAMNSGKNDNSRFITLPKIGIQQLENPTISDRKLIEVVSSSQLRVYEIPKPAAKNKLPKYETKVVKSEYSFPDSTLKRFSSITQISNTKFVVSGGCEYTNPLQKSSIISVFCAETGQLKKVGDLPEGLSSHSSVYVEPRVYFIGGKLSEGVITKMCSCIDIAKMEAGELAALNYASASACVVAWRGTHVYKAGGIGECFGEWSVSPYIERYSIAGDYWEVINPDLRESCLGSLSDFQFFAHSMAYATSNNQLVLFGGFDVNKKDSNFGCVIAIIESGAEGDQHEIVDHGLVKGLQPGGYWNSQIIVEREIVEAAGREKDGRRKVDKIEVETIHFLRTSVAPSLETKLSSLMLK